MNEPSPPSPDRVSNKAADNERTKLLASALNTLGTATITVGVLAPATGILYGFSSPTPGRTLSELIAAALVRLVAGSTLHILGQLALGRIKE